MKALITDIQRFCMHDGPGIRTTVFFKGCPLRCLWCHNPETQKGTRQIYYYPSKCIGCGECTSCPSGGNSMERESHRFHREKCAECGQCTEVCPTGALELCGKWMEIEDIIEMVKEDRAFYGAEGGVTLSGGEPMFQPEACLALLRKAKENGMTTAVETCGYFEEVFLEELVKNADLLLWDYKDSDEERHLNNTGKSNQKIISNLKKADALGAKIILRCILLKGINLNEVHLFRIKRQAEELQNVIRVEFLPCHAMGEAKATALGMDYGRIKEYIPSKEEMAWAQAYYDSL